MITRRTPIRRTALKRSTKPIARRTPVRKFRVKLRRGHLTKLEKGAIRHDVYVETGGRCEIRKHPQCIRGVLPEFGITPWDHWHLVHIRSRGAGGKWDRANLKGGCHYCHLISLHVEGGNGKIVPAKDGTLMKTFLLALLVLTCGSGFAQSPPATNLACRIASASEGQHHWEAFWHDDHHVEFYVCDIEDSPKTIVAPQPAKAPETYKWIEPKCTVQGGDFNLETCETSWMLYQVSDGKIVGEVASSIRGKTWNAWDRELDRPVAEFVTREQAQAFLEKRFK